MSEKYLPVVPSWFRLPEYVRDLLARVISLEKAPSGDSRPYKVFTANIIESGNSIVYDSILENTLGVIPTISRVATGYYELTTSGLFTVGKTALFGTASAEEIASSIMYLNQFNADTVAIYTSFEEISSDNVLVYPTTIEIRVYE